MVFLPAFIYALDAGDYDRAFEILDMPYAASMDGDAEIEESSMDVSDSEGMFNSVECYEEVFFNSIEAAESNLSAYPSIITEAFVWSVEDFMAICEIWDVDQASVLEDQPVSSSIPTLILNGSYDPVTPPAWAESAADHLPNSQVFIFPGVGHSVIDSGSCAQNILLDFLGDPDRQVDGSCLAEHPFPKFVIDP